MCEIVLNEVSFSYSSDIVLDKISLTINKGDFTVIVGPNGAGKSTLIKTIAGLITPQSGRIFLDGQSVDKAQARGLISYVPQNYDKGGAGFPATVAEIVSLGLISVVKKVKSKKAANHIVGHMLKLVDAENLKNRRIGDLSGGQMQRVMVARALAGNPELLLLDEPTSGIDFNASSKIYETLGDLNRNLGITIVMVSHDIENATRWAGKVACINRAVCFYGDSEEFRTSHNDTKHLFFRMF